MKKVKSAVEMEVSYKTLKAVVVYIDRQFHNKPKPYTRYVKRTSNIGDRVRSSS
ncbi:hypothetical protein RYX45_24320 [Alkalihalophilus pseudofirmus]|uniref:Uncharacterized protein n=1 Tax=Alkalihalophilus pseudofirmus TaxID=79885 RepID=A0AAJ2NTE6_ALKPS|nr:hypothetical protein [Alkalihalophilus pseudofirmus]MDV2888291.1 hypothetical protein [Alkalihalophilus pseudofirmus]